MMLWISAKCNDQCEVYTEGLYHCGYPLDMPGLMGGDYIDFGVDIETGRIRNWDTVIKPALMKVIEDARINLQR
jgi:hypothetical protein